MRAMTPKPRDEEGAYAVLFGILLVVIVGFAALAVDIGNAVARKSDVQGQADFAALAAGRASDGSFGAADKTAIYAAAAASLNKNSPQNRPCSESYCVQPADMHDGNLADGEVTFPSGRIKVTAPESLVDYGFAAALGADDKTVQASATVGLFSPGVGTLPMYAVSNCDYGPQTLTDPAGGPAAPILPIGLASSTQTANASLTDIVTPNPAQIPVSNPAGPGPGLTLSGIDFHKPANGPNEAWVTKIGFFLEDGSAPVEVTYNTTEWPAAATPPDPNRTDTSLHIDAIPQQVATTEKLWWIRVWQEKLDGTGGTWSSIANAQPLRVGTAVLRCGSGASEGNFGTLSVPRWDVATADDLPVTIAEGPDDPMTLTKHTTWVPGGLCVHGVNNAVMSGDPNPGPNPGTNCLSTDPGLPAGVATRGLVTGLNTSKGYVRGRLDGSDHPTSSCGRSNYNVDLGPQQPSTNNDILSCYLTNGQTLASVASSASPAGTAFDDEIYLSPRFAWVPILAEEPTCGGCQNYSITDFRPAFITDETTAASKASSDVTTKNGLITQGTGIKEVKVFFFNMNSLPATTPGPTTGYLGVGPKIVRLID